MKNLTIILLLTTLSITELLFKSIETTKYGSLITFTNNNGYYIDFTE